jgi:hypothetical protein
MLKPRARGFVEYYDTKTPGLALRVQPTGKKTTARVRVRTTREAPAKAGESAAVVLLKDLATEFIERHCQKKKKSWNQDVYCGSTPRSARTGTTGWSARSSGAMGRSFSTRSRTHRAMHRPRPITCARLCRLFRLGISQRIEAIEYNPAHGD